MPKNMSGRTAEEAGPEGLIQYPNPEKARDGSETQQARPVAVEARWKTEARSAAWDELWRRIFADVLQEEGQMPQAQGITPEQEILEVD